MGGCFVPGCKGGYKNEKKTHLFRPHKNVADRWCVILNRMRADVKFDPTNKNHCVCCDHFEDRYLVKEFKHKIQGKDVSIPRDKWTIEEDAIPTLFPNLPKLLQPTQSKPRRILKKLDVLPFKKRKLSPPEETPASDRDSDFEHEGTFNLIDWWAKNNHLFSNWIVDVSSELFQSMIKLKYFDGCPKIDKAITVGRTGELESAQFFIGDKNVTMQLIPSAISNPDMMGIITMLEKMKLCQGINGFSSVSKCQGGDNKTGKWFAVACQGIGSMDVCVACRILHKRLSRKLNCSRPVKPKCTYTIRRKLKYYQVRSSKLTKEVTGLKKTIQIFQKAASTFDLKYLDDCLSHLNLSTSMKAGILHSIQSACIKSPKGMRYSSNWLFECLLLKIKSPAAYRHLRDSKILPLPHPSTLTKLISSQKCEFGFNQNSLNAIKRAFASKIQRDRQGVLVFDEIQLRETVEYNSTTHRFDGFVDYAEFTGELVKNQDRGKLANHALVIMYRPLNDNWVQPIAAFATRNAASGTAIHKIILSAVIKLEEVGAEVVTVICDGSKPNKSFWKQCGVGVVDGNVVNKIVHPCDDSRSLYFCSDVPHVFKCIRNHFLKYTVVTFFDKEIDFSFYEKLIEEDSKRSCGLRKCPKLTRSHVRPNNFEKMVVPLATQLFSRSVATGIAFYRECGMEDFVNSEATEEFTHCMNDLFDALNARLPKFGIRLDSEQFKILENFSSQLETHSKNIEDKNIGNVGLASRETYDALRVTLQSTIEVCRYLINDMGYVYVLTGKLNQDCLEKFFGILRAAGGGEDHPTITNFVQLFRLLSLYNPIKQILKGNVRSDEDICMLENFEFDLRKNAKQMRSEEGLIQQNLEDILIAKIVESRSIDQTERHESGNVLDKNIVYYLTGFLCFKSRKFLSCQECISSISTDVAEVEDAISRLTNLVNYGPLHHPSKAFFNLILSLETSICFLLTTNLTSGDILLDCIQNVTLYDVDCIGCKAEGHLENLITTLCPYYITMRLHFFASSKRNDLGHGKATKNKRKESKLTC